LRVADWSSIKTAVQARQELRKAFQSARELRFEAGEQVLPREELEQRIKIVFGTFAESMNKMELWTGEDSSRRSVPI
jgi:SpoU rRNA methylase family enzyme